MRDLVNVGKPGGHRKIESGDAYRIVLKNAKLDELEMFREFRRQLFCDDVIKDELTLEIRNGGMYWWEYWGCWLTYGQY